MAWTVSPFGPLHDKGVPPAPTAPPPPPPPSPDTLPVAVPPAPVLPPSDVSPPLPTEPPVVTPTVPLPSKQVLPPQPGPSMRAVNPRMTQCSFSICICFGSFTNHDAQSIHASANRATSGPPVSASSRSALRTRMGWSCTSGLFHRDVGETEGERLVPGCAAGH